MKQMVAAQLHELLEKTEESQKQKRPQNCGGAGKRIAIKNEGYKFVAEQPDGHRFKMRGVSVSRKRPTDGGGASMFTQNRA